MKKMIAKYKGSKKAIIGTVLVVALAAFGVNALFKKDMQSTVETPGGETPIETPVTTPTKRPSTTNPTVSVGVADTRSYTELSGLFKDKSLQFGQGCQVLKNTQAYKVGSDILLDNRTSTAMAIKIGSNTYNLGSYGYKVVSLDQIGTFLVDCNSQQNVATLIVQK